MKKITPYLISGLIALTTLTPDNAEARRFFRQRRTRTYSSRQTEYSNTRTQPSRKSILYSRYSPGFIDSIFTEPFEDMSKIVPIIITMVVRIAGI